MKIGVISDTHFKPCLENCIDDWILKAFEGVEMIFHAGDLTDLDLLNGLSIIAPTYAVKGNMDDFHPDLPYFREIVAEENFSIAISHLKNEAYGKKSPSCKMIIYGHSHIPEFVQEGGIWYLNPGSPSKPRGGSKPSVAILNIINGIPEVEFKLAPPKADE
ncbi:MAG: metallophosphoesterase family protein [Candidatus Riflebacteria bacterium]|nr:metallophosphoesterase family protein [Candidatus Riflebacteria bacterium]